MATTQKTITVLGGSGYVGKHCIYKLLKTTDCKVISICRSGKTDMSLYSDLNINDLLRLDIVKGNALNIEDIKDPLGKSSGVIHAIGTLVSLKSKNEEGSYNKLSTETVKTSLNALKEKVNSQSSLSKVNYVYISAERGLPFPLSLLLSGYIESKREAEKILLNSEYVNPAILRPGVICHPKIRNWSVPLYYSVNLVSFIEKNLLDKVIKIGDPLQLPARGTLLDNLGEYAVKGALGNLGKKILGADELI